MRLAHIAVAATLLLPAVNQCDPTVPEVPGRCTQWEAMLGVYPDWDVVTMSRFMYRESHCQPGQVSRTHDFGLLQVHVNAATFTTPMRTGFGPLATECGINAGSDLLDAGKNVECAHVLFDAFGYAPWKG